MLTSNIYNIANAQIIETENNAHFSGTAFEQDVLLQKPIIVMYSSTTNQFYTINLPSNGDSSDQFVGIFSDG